MINQFAERNTLIIDIDSGCPEYIDPKGAYDRIANICKRKSQTPNVNGLMYAKGEGRRTSGRLSISFYCLPIFDWVIRIHKSLAIRVVHKRVFTVQVNQPMKLHGENCLSQ